MKVVVIGKEPFYTYPTLVIVSDDVVGEGVVGNAILEMYPEFNVVSVCRSAVTCNIGADEVADHLVLGIGPAMRDLDACATIAGENIVFAWSVATDYIGVGIVVYVDALPAIRDPTVPGWTKADQIVHDDVGVCGLVEDPDAVQGASGDDIALLRRRTT